MTREQRIAALLETVILETSRIFAVNQSVDKREHHDTLAGMVKLQADLEEERGGK